MGSSEITFETAEKTASSPRIADLDTSAFTASDVLNLILQRSEIIRDQANHNRYIKAWINGDTAPLTELITTIGAQELIRRAAAFILLEYEELRPILAKAPPRAGTDIGCGYALIDLFLAQDFDCAMTLIDLEQTNERHFGFQPTGSAYSDLATAAAFLQSNGIAPSRITTINPERDSVADIRDQDLVMSLISCGFHYPWTTYESFFRDAVKPGGRIILDLRRKTAEKTIAEMSSLGSTEELSAGASQKAARVLVTRHMRPA